MERLKSIFRAVSFMFWFIIYAIVFNALYDGFLDLFSGPISAVISGLLGGIFLVYVVQVYKKYINNTFRSRIYNGIPVFILISLLDMNDYQTSDLVFRTITAISIYTVMSFIIVRLANRRQNISSLS